MKEENKKLVIEEIVQRFLSWKLPKDFCPDGGISFKPGNSQQDTYENSGWPVGTNLFDARQAKEMIMHILNVQDTDTMNTKKDKDPELKVLDSTRLTSFWSNEDNKTVVVTMLFWSDGSVTWVKE